MPVRPPAALALLAITACASRTAARAADPSGPRAAALTPYTDSIPGTLVTWQMVPVPGGPVTVGDSTLTVASFWIGRTELLWDAYDVFAFLERDSGVAGGDAVARPSRPYGAPDHGFGHRGYATLSVTRAAAEAFCAWLSIRTGKRYRLPTEAEWQRAATLALGDGPLAPERRDAIAWHAGNSGGRAHAAATRQPDALGLSDLLGNAAEWVMPADGRLVTRGGSWRDPPARVDARARAVQDYTWNETDPQLPKSRWWLSDGSFVGFRIVREP
jgi:formylglycine-generating enzyme required for sulfatase activity